MHIARRRTALTAAALGLAGISGTALVGASAAERRGEPARAAQQAVGGKFSLIQMIHTTNSSFGALSDVKPWGGETTTGSEFRYRGIPCSGNAPVNNIASDLPSYSTRVRGSRAPSSMRAHPFSMKIIERRGKKELLGSIRFTVCHLKGGPTAKDDPVPDGSKPQILAGFRATFSRQTDELMRFAGKFRFEGGTQRYEGLEGSGVIAGYFFCFAPEGCAAKGGKYLDGQFTMSGRYYDATPNLAGG